MAPGWSLTLLNLLKRTFFFFVSRVLNKTEQQEAWQEVQKQNIAFKTDRLLMGRQLPLVFT